jgi:hypothetical protein
MAEKYYSSQFDIKANAKINFKLTNPPSVFQLVS